MLCVLVGVDVRVYVVPTSLSSVGTYLAITDPWYRRQVFAPFHNGIDVLPRLQLVEEAIVSDEGEPPRSDIVTPT